MCLPHCCLLPCSQRWLSPRQYLAYAGRHIALKKAVRAVNNPRGPRAFGRPRGWVVKFLAELQISGKNPPENMPGCNIIMRQTTEWRYNCSTSSQGFPYELRRCNCKAAIDDRLWQKNHLLSFHWSKELRAVSTCARNASKLHALKIFCQRFSKAVYYNEHQSGIQKEKYKEVN